MSRQAYLAGLPLPRFAQCHGGYEPVKRQSQGGEKAKAGDDALTELPPHLEQALLQLIQDPSLADPPPHTTQLPPHIQGPPLGTSRDIPQVLTSSEESDMTGQPRCFTFGRDGCDRDFIKMLGVLISIAKTWSTSRKPSVCCRKLRNGLAAEPSASSMLLLSR